jgi:tetratricopeptide (TPR) repeat protein
MAHALCDQGRPREAEDMARWALDQAPQLPGAHVALARARFEQGQVRESRVILEAVVLRNPAFFAAHRWLAEVLVRLGDWPAASEILVRAEALTPGDTRIAELVRQVMGAPPAPPVPPPRRTTKGQAAVPGGARATGQMAATPAARATGQASMSGVPVPPVSPGLLQSGARMYTYEEPAVTANLPASKAAGNSEGPVAPRSTALLRLREAKTLAPRRDDPSSRSRPSGARPATGVKARGQRPRDIRRRLGQSLAGLGDRLAFWRRTSFDPRLILLALGGLGIFVVTVILVSWILRQPGLPEVVKVMKRPAAEVTPALGPVVAGSFTELAGIRARDRRRKAGYEAELESAEAFISSRALLAEALLASEYGRPLDPDSEIWADELAEKEGGLGGPDDLLATRVLDRLVRGDRKGAAELARTRGLSTSGSPLLRFVEGRRLEREGNVAAALARIGADAERSPFLPLRLLRAELLLDQANPSAALTLVTSVLKESRGHPAALRLLLETRAALGQPLSPDERDDVARVCRLAERWIPTLHAACRLHEGVTERREGHHKKALRAALRAADAAPAEPRILAMIAQLLGNLGASREAEEVLARAEVLADGRFPPLAWARAGLGVGRSRGTRLPEGPAPGPEARLIAARSTFVGLPGRRRELGSLGVTPSLVKTDEDLRWVAEGAVARNKKAQLQLTRKLRGQKDGGKAAGPVANYVAGTLARRSGQGPLAESLLGRSLDGHGDACRAASLYRLALRDGGRNPLANVRLQRAIGKLGCAEPPESLRRD